jgi:mannitol 2-dehydrogenase
MKPMRLNSSTLDRIESVATPDYDRSTLRTGIVHFGVGGFHRAHQAMYLDRLLALGGSAEWGICGVGTMPGDVRMRDVMVDQDGLYTLALRFPDGSWQAGVIGSIVQYLYAPDDPEAVIEKIASPDTRIVSLTVTEGGYNFSPVTGEFDATNADVIADAAGTRAPRTVFGLVVEGLRRRRDRGLGPVTVMSCDNIAHNGAVARRAIIAYARMVDGGLADWIERNVSFPSSMVDRITPVTTAEVTAEVTERFGIEDAWPVACEPFTQWVLEDDFVAGRPALEEVGVQLVDDVNPYELMKLRLLNASHQGLAYLPYLAGYRLVHEAVQDPEIAGFIRGYMDEEATPTLAPVPGIDLDEYKDTLLARFGNPYVRDTVARLCAESSDRIPKWLVPVINSQLATGGPIARSAAIVASWARYAEGIDEQGEPIAVVDAARDELMAAAAEQRARPTAFIENRRFFGDLVDDERFVAAYLFALDHLHADGAAVTVGLLGRGGLGAVD